MSGPIPESSCHVQDLYDYLLPLPVREVYQQVIGSRYTWYQAPVTGTATLLVEDRPVCLLQEFGSGLALSSSGLLRQLEQFLEAGHGDYPVVSTYQPGSEELPPGHTLIAPLFQAHLTTEFTDRPRVLHILTCSVHLILPPLP